MWKRKQQKPIERAFVNEFFREMREELDAKLARLDVFLTVKEILASNPKACSQGYYSRIEYDEKAFVEKCLRANLCPRTAKFLMLGEVAIWRDARKGRERSKLRLVA